MRATVVTGLVLMCGCAFQGSSSSEVDAGSEADAAKPRVDASDDAMPAAHVITLVDGVDGYDGTFDTYIHEGEGGIPHGTELQLSADGSDASNEVWALLQFTDLEDSFPTAATVLEATLTITVIDVGQDLRLHDALIAWDELSTWNGLGQPIAGASYDPATVATLPQGMLGAVELDVTASVTRWLVSPSTNHGWFFEPTGGNGVEISSRESAAKPRLVITFSDD